MAGGEPTTDANYVLRKEYLALLRGAIYYTFKKSGVIKNRIDALALGLPVSNFAKHKDALVKVAKGVHVVPVPIGLRGIWGPTVEVTVDKVLVLPQPLGALRTHAGKESAVINANSTNLILDPGYNTFDWLMATGMRADLERSGSFMGGVAHLLREVSQQASMNLGVGFINLIECECALETGVLVVDAKKYDFLPFRAVAENAAEEFVAQFCNALNFSRRFDHIVMAGGGAKYYIDALRKRFPDHLILVDDDSVMANARGFYLFANGLLAQG